MPEDRRILHSKERIKDSFISCLQTTSLDKVTVKKICDVAGINRSTFYAHYTDPFILFEEIFKEYFDELFEGLDDISEDKKTIRRFLDRAAKYMEDHRDITFALFRADRAKFKDMNMSIISNSQLFNKARNKVPVEYLEEFSLEGALSVLMLWLSKERREPPTEIADTVSRLISEL